MRALMLLSSGTTAFIGIVAPYSHSHNKVIPVPIHIGPADLSQISSIGTKTKIHVVTAPSGGAVITVVNPPKPTTAAG